MGPGTRIGHYRVLRKLGAGAMGAIYQVEHTLIGRSAAIKTLLPALSEDREAVDRFFNEARATSSIRDPGIVQLFDFGFHVDGTAFLVMELLEGESIGDRIDRLGRVAPDEALRIIGQAASSLSAAHERGIVHRDLKPDNMMMVADAAAQGGERPKIFDFGIAKLEREVSRSITANGTMLGTPLYMPPEQARGAENVDARADVYSLGCVLFHMLTGQPPFDAESGVDIIMEHLLAPAPVPSQIVPGIPTCIDELVLRCLAKDPDDRIASMSELRVECGAALAQMHRAITHGDTMSGPAIPEAPHRRLRGSLAAATLLGVGAIVAIAIGVELAPDRSASAASLAAPPAVETVELPPPPPPPPSPSPSLPPPQVAPEPRTSVVKPPHVEKRVVKTKRATKRAAARRRAPPPPPPPAEKDPYARR